MCGGGGGQRGSYAGPNTSSTSKMYQPLLRFCRHGEFLADSTPQSETRCHGRERYKCSLSFRNRTIMEVEKEISMVTQAAVAVGRGRVRKSSSESYLGFQIKM